VIGRGERRNKRNGRGETQEAVDFAVANESKAPRNLELAHYQTFGREPFGEAIGAFKERGAATGVILRNGYIVAEWGDPARVDMTFSVTKSFISTIVGLAFDRRIIKSLQDRANGYSSPINLTGKTINSTTRNCSENRDCWNYLKQKTIAKSPGTAFCGRRAIGKELSGANPTGLTDRTETRIIGLAETKRAGRGLRVQRRARQCTGARRAQSLAQASAAGFKENVMDEIGASDSWRWLGYENSWVVMDGLPVQSVSGGGHWGGGMFISATDMARFGLLSLNRGKWNKKQILSEEFFRQATTPTVAQPTTAYELFSQHRPQALSDAPAVRFRARRQRDEYHLR
jgi:hypothetical protein